MKMRRESTAARGFIILLVACSGGSAVQDPMDLDPTVGVISGSVRDSHGLAIAEAEVLVQPGDLHATSNGQGFYEVEVSLADDQAAYTVVVAHEEFAMATGAVTITKSDPAVVFDVELPSRDEDPPLEALDIAQYTLPGPWRTGPTIDFMIDARNESPAAILNLVIVDTLDAEFEHEISLDDITINQENFPTAAVTLGPDGRSFRIELGTLEPTPAPVRAFTLQAPTPQANGVFCNRVLASGDLEGEPRTDIEINCLVS